MGFVTMKRCYACSALFRYPAKWNAFDEHAVNRGAVFQGADRTGL
jgi:hypothetical protein